MNKEAGFFRDLLAKALKPGAAAPAVSAAKIVHTLPTYKSYSELPKQIQRGLYRSSKERGIESLFGIPAVGLSKMISGEKRTGRAIHKYIDKPALRADMALGRAGMSVADMIMPKSWAEKLFSHEEKVRVGRTLHKSFRRTSGMAPISHAADIAKPIVFGMALEKGVDKFRHPETKTASSVFNLSVMKKVATIQASGVSWKTDVMEKQQLRKVADTMLCLLRQNKEHEKRAQATRLLYKQAALGHIELPKSFEEFQTKVAALMGEDLAVVEKALEYSQGGSVKLGELDSTDSTKPRDATEAFQAAIIGEEY